MYASLSATPSRRIVIPDTANKRIWLTTRDRLRIIADANALSMTRTVDVLACFWLLLEDGERRHAIRHATPPDDRAATSQPIWAHTADALDSIHRGTGIDGVRLIEVLVTAWENSAHDDDRRTKAIQLSTAQTTEEQTC